MQAATHPPKPPPRRGVWQDRITGLYRRFTVHQLALAWWCYREKHITRRQLRVYFAAAEMDERRRWTKQDGQGGRRPLYGLDEIKALLGTKGTRTADAALSADVKALGKLGLVEITPRRITLAQSIEQIHLEDVASFWPMFEQIANNRRTVPVPRRTCRALAAGLRPAVMATMIAMMIRSLYWHRPGPEGQGGYRVDGRTKRAWIAEVFGVSVRAVTEARATLIDLGWLRPLESTQWHLNRYGSRDEINVHAFCREDDQEQGGAAGQSASPPADNSGQSASPCLNRSPSSNEEDLNTRKPAPTRAGPVPPGAGVSVETGSGGGKEKPSGRSDPPSKPNLHNITEADLRDTGRLLELHRQAIAAGHPVGGEAGRLDFISLAERARSTGHNPPKLFAWLLKHRRFDFIAIANEEAAAARLRQLHNGKREQGRAVNRQACDAPAEHTADEKFIIACVRVAKQHRCEPFRVAQLKGWTRQRWDEQYQAFQAQQHQRWHRLEE